MVGRAAIEETEKDLHTGTMTLTCFLLLVTMIDFLQSLNIYLLLTTLGGVGFGGALWHSSKPVMLRYGWESWPTRSLFQVLGDYNDRLLTILEQSRTILNNLEHISTSHDFGGMMVVVVVVVMVLLMMMMRMMMMMMMIMMRQKPVRDTGKRWRLAVQIPCMNQRKKCLQTTSSTFTRKRRMKIGWKQPSCENSNT